MQAITILALIFVVGTIVYYLWRAKRDSDGIKSVADLFIHPSNLGSGKVAATFFCSQMSLATVFIAIFQLTPGLGWALVWSPITFAMGYVLLGMTFAPKIAVSLLPGETIHGFLGRVYNFPALRVTSSVATLIGLLGMFATELLVGAYVFRAPFGGVDAYWPALLCLAICVIAYSTIGGFRTVLRNDGLQFIMICGLLLLMWLLVSDKPSLPTKPLNTNIFLSGALILNLALINIPFPLIDMTAWQRIGASASPEKGRLGVLLAAAGFLVTWIYLIWAATKMSGAVDGNDIIGNFDQLFTSWASVGITQSALAALCFAGMAAAILASADTVLIGAGQVICTDLFRRPKQPNESDFREIARARRVMTFAAVLGLGFCGLLLLRGFKVADIVFVLFGGTLGLLPCVVYALYGSATKAQKLGRAAVGSIITGVGASWGYGVWAFQIGRSVYDAPIVAIVAASLVFGTCLITKKAH